MPLIEGRVRRAAGWTLLVVTLIILLPAIGLLQSPNLLVTGCDLMRDSGSCLPMQGQSLRIWVDAPDAARLSTLIDLRRVPFEERKVQGGRLLELTVPSDASFLSVHVRDRWRWRWGLVRFTKRNEPEWLRRAWALREKNQVSEAQHLLDEHWSDPVPEEARARMHSLAARIASERLRPDTESLLRQSIVALERAGLLSDALDERNFLVNLLAQQKGRLPDAEQVIREAAPRYGAVPDLAPWRDWQLAQLASLRGDLRQALRHMNAGLELARRTYNEQAISDIDQMAVTVLVLLGRIEDAKRLVKEMLALPKLPPCRRVELLKSMGSLELRTAEAGPIGPSRHLDAARASILEARELTSSQGDTTQKCSLPRSAAQALTDLAHIAAQEGDDAQVKRLVEDAQLQRGKGQPAVDLEDAQMTLEWTALLADAELRSGSTERAQALYLELQRLSGPSDLFGMAWRAQIGLAQVAESKGRSAEALQRYQAAEEYLDFQSRSAPLGAGRGGFLGRHSRGTALYVDLLARTHGDGEPGADQQSLQKAARVIRHARVRSLLGFLAMDRVARLPPEQHRQYSEALESYRKLRGELDALQVQRDQGSADTIQRTAAAIEQLSQQSVQRLEDALRILAGTSGSSPQAYTYRPVAADEALLTCHPVKKGWLCLLLTGNDVTAHRLPELDVGASRAQLSAALLAPFSRALDPSRIKRLKVVAYGPMRELDVHLLPFGPRGKPLWHTLPVVYALDLPTQALGEAGAAQQELRLARRAFLLIDSEGRLPQSLESARPILDSLAQAQVQVEHAEQSVAWQGDWTGKAAAKWLSRAELLQKIAGAELFHDATHFNFSASDGLRSHIPLSDTTGLSIGDVLTLSQAPRYVTLFGCETARSSEELGDVEGLGLAQAFLVRGSLWSVGTVRKVGDELAARLATRFYAELTKHPEPYRALRAAVEEVGVSIPDTHDQITPFNDLGAFRVYVP